MATTPGTFLGATAVPSEARLGTAPRVTPTPVRCRRKLVSSLRISSSDWMSRTVPLPALTPAEGADSPGPTARTTFGCGFSGGGSGALVGLALRADVPLVPDEASATAATTQAHAASAAA